MPFEKGEIQGIVSYFLNKHLDERGFLTEIFRMDQSPENFRPEMSYISYTEPGIARGPHEHKFQTDLFSFLGERRPL